MDDLLTFLICAALIIWLWGSWSPQNKEKLDEKVDGIKASIHEATKPKE
tara:strand:+ start:951 stop:1097 length:147 start_codon:yes stop_codon:yes gene_type:complete